jgi:hypothetical protein
MAEKAEKKGLRHGGRPKRDLQRVTFFLDTSNLEVMRKIAVEETLTESDIFRRACREFVQRHAKEVKQR